MTFTGDVNRHKKRASRVAKPPEFQKPSIIHPTAPSTLARTFEVFLEEHNTERDSCVTNV